VLAAVWGAYAQGQGTNGPSSFGGELRGSTEIKGKVLCVGCTVDDVLNAQPEEHNLYLLKYDRGQFAKAHRGRDSVSRS